MLKERAIEQAKREAKRHNVTIALVHAPIETAEEEGDYGFCPVEAVDMLFRNGTVEHYITPAGEVNRP